MRHLNFLAIRLGPGQGHPKLQCDTYISWRFGLVPARDTPNYNVTLESFGTCDVPASVRAYMHALYIYLYVYIYIYICISPYKLAMASIDKTAGVWDAFTGEQLLTLRGHEGEVRGVAVFPDGLKLATASYDKTVRVFHNETDSSASEGLLVLLHALDASDFEFARRFSHQFLPNVSKLVSEGTGNRLVSMDWDLSMHS